jgi:hypothetical protein
VDTVQVSNIFVQKIKQFCSITTKTLKHSFYSQLIQLSDNSFQNLTLLACGSPRLKNIPGSATTSLPSPLPSAPTMMTAGPGAKGARGVVAVAIRGH